MDPKEANRALQKGKDFNRENKWKKARKTTSETKTQQRQNSENVDFSLDFVRLLHTWLKSRRTRGRRGSKQV